jgi:hypothetical protein
LYEFVVKHMPHDELWTCITVFFVTRFCVLYHQYVLSLVRIPATYW